LFHVCATVIGSVQDQECARGAAARLKACIENGGGLRVSAGPLHLGRTLQLPVVADVRGRERALDLARHLASCVQGERVSMVLSVRDLGRGEEILHRVVVPD